MQVTPPYTDPTAVVGRRIVAYIVDSLVILGITVATFLALAEDNPFEIGQDAFGAFPGDEDTELSTAWDYGEAVGGFISVDLDEGEIDVRIVEGGSFWAVNAVGLAVGIGLLVVMQGASGKTPGKALLGLTTVNAEGQPPGLGKAFVRWLLLFVDSFCILPGLITSLASKGHRRIGDMAAGTYVVRSAAAGQPVQIGAPAPAYQQQDQPWAQPQPASVGQPAADAQWDAARQAWIRWDGTQWTQHDPSVPGSWRPIS